MEEKKYTYDYPRPAVCVDIALIAVDKEGMPSILLIERGEEPFKGMWALPGGFIEEFEGLNDAAVRELKEETSIEGVTLQRFNVYDKPNRDPRGRTISMVFMGFAEQSQIHPIAGDDAKNAHYFKLNEIPLLAFDHVDIVKDVINYIAKHVNQIHN